MTINISKEHQDPQDSQLILAITGDSEYIRQKLMEILIQIERYGKPIDGSSISGNNISEVITPVWDSKTY